MLLWPSPDLCVGAGVDELLLLPEGAIVEFPPPGSICVAVGECVEFPSGCTGTPVTNEEGAVVGPLCGGIVSGLLGGNVTDKVGLNEATLGGKLGGDDGTENVETVGDSVTSVTGKVGGIVSNTLDKRDGGASGDGAEVLLTGDSVTLIAVTGEVGEDVDLTKDPTSASFKLDVGDAVAFAMRLTGLAVVFLVGRAVMGFAVGNCVGDLV